MSKVREKREDFLRSTHGSVGLTNVTGNLTWGGGEGEGGVSEVCW